jgi:hypothetical protein
LVIMTRIALLPKDETVVVGGTDGVSVGVAMGT